VHCCSDLVQSRHAALSAGGRQSPFPPVWARLSLDLMRTENMRKFAGAVVLALVLATARVGPAHAWGDEGHEVIGLIADSLLEPGVRTKVQAMLAADTDDLTAHNIAD